MVVEIVKHTERRLLTPQTKWELSNEIEAFIFQEFEEAAYLLNQMGIHPCHLVATLHEMEIDGLLEGCPLCGPVPSSV